MQHNVFLALLAETGMIGLGLFLLFLAILSHASWQLWRSQGAELASRQLGLLMFLMLFCLRDHGHVPRSVTDPDGPHVDVLPGGGRARIAVTDGTSRWADGGAGHRGAVS